jgi:hypothetical protein
MYMFGASGEVVAAASTRSQTLANAVASTSGGSDEVLHPRHAGPTDQVGQARLPLSFGLVDTTVVGVKNPVPLRDGDSISKDVTQALAYKILHMPIFSGSELMAPDFKPAGVFHLAGRMLEGKADLPSLQISQAVVDVPVPEEVEDLANLRASLADAAIIAFGLAAVLEAGITVRRYIRVDNGYAANRAVRHHIQQLLLRYPAQLSTSAILGCCGQLPQDVTMISDEDLRRLGHVDLLIAGWPC